jgi:hypothetical protein
MANLQNPIIKFCRKDFYLTFEEARDLEVDLTLLSTLDVDVFKRILDMTKRPPKDIFTYLNDSKSLYKLTDDVNLLLLKYRIFQLEDLFRLTDDRLKHYQFLITKLGPWVFRERHGQLVQSSLSLDPIQQLMVDEIMEPDERTEPNS